MGVFKINKYNQFHNNISGEFIKINASLAYFDGYF